MLSSHDHDSDEDEELNCPSDVDDSTSLIETIQQLRSRKVPKSYESKLTGGPEGEFLESHEQDEFLSDMKAQARLLDSVWRYFLIGIGFLMICMVVLFLVMHVLFGKDATAFHRQLEPHIGRGTLLVLQLLSLCAHVCTLVFAFHLPRPQEEYMLIGLITTVVSSVLFVFTLYVKSMLALSLSSLWIPVTNILYFCACAYASYDASVIEKEIKHLSKSTYRYSSI